MWTSASRARARRSREALEVDGTRRQNGKTLIDYGFHIAITDLARHRNGWTSSPRCPSRASPRTSSSWRTRASCAVDDETLFRAMQVAAASGALVMVHAENGDAIDVLVRKRSPPGLHRADPPRAHAGRPSSRARRRTAPSSSRGSPAARSMSSTSPAREAVEPIRRAREQGWDVWGESCTQYFFRSIDDLCAQPNFEGAKYVYSPPARDAGQPRRPVDAVRTDALSAISTDHCAFLWEGQKTHGEADFTKIPNGRPGLEDRLKHDPPFRSPRRALHLNRLVHLFATAAGEAVRPLPAEGDGGGRRRRRPRRLRPPTRETISAADAPLEVRLQPLRGHRGDRRAGARASARPVLVEDGELVGTPGMGRFVRRARFGDRSRRARPSHRKQGFFTSDEQKLR